MIMSGKGAGGTSHDAVVVVGLGRFGGSLTVELARRGLKVLAIDNRREAARVLAGSSAAFAAADATDADVLRELGVAGFGRAVVAIGGDLQISILITSVLVELEIGEIWARAVSATHERILRRLGAHRVLIPAREAGVRVAHLIDGQMPDRMQADGNFTVIKVRPPQDCLGVPLAASHVRDRYGVTLIAVKHKDGQFTHATPTTQLSTDDVVLICGRTKQIDTFIQQPDS